MQVIALVDGVSPHGIGHGEEVTYKMWDWLKWDEATRIIKPESRALRSTDLSSVQALAPPLVEQLTQAKDVVVADTWRSGFSVPSVADLGDKVAHLVASELAIAGVCLKATPSGRGLFAQKSFRDGDEICSVSAVWKKSHAEIHALLQQAGNTILLDRLIRIDGLADGAEAISVYGVRVGIAGFARHYVDAQRRGGAKRIK